MEEYIRIFEGILNEACDGTTNSNKYLPLLFDTKEMKYTNIVPVTKITKHYPNIYEPTIIILNRKKLETILIEYVNHCTNFYKDKNITIKELLYHSLSNMMLDEFDDISKHFKRRMDFMNNERLYDYFESKNIGYIDTLCGNLVVGVNKEKIYSTTPCSINVSIERVINDKLYYFDFASICFGISDRKAYITNFTSPAPRKINEEDKEYIAELENYQLGINNLLNKIIKTKEINPVGLIPLLVLLTLLKERGIKEIIVPTTFVNKNNGLEIICHQNIAKYSKMYDQAIIDDDISKKNEAISHLNMNKRMLSNRAKKDEEANIEFIKNFKFLEEIFSDYKIYDYPMQSDSSLHFNIIPNGNTCTNKVLEEISNSVSTYEDIIRKTKDI